YSRQTVELATSKGHFSGAGFMGKGADIVSVNRNYNEHLVRDAATTASQSAFDNARYEQLAALEGVFPMGEAGLSHAASQLFGAMSDLASRPHDIPSRQVVLSRANELASRFNAANSKLDDQQRGVTSDLKVSIGQVNELSRRIAALNQQVAAVRGSGHTPNDLMDQRDQLIQRLSALVPVTTIEASDGSLSVFLGGAQTLVLSNQSEVLSVGVDANDGQRSTIMIGTGTDQRQISSEDSLYSGSIGGLLRFQNVDLVRARDMLNGLATAVATQINDVHTAGLDLDGNAGGPLFAGRAAASINAGNLMLMISDPRQLAAAADEGGQIIDNANALKLAALRDLAFVPGSVLGEASLTSVYRFTDAYGAAMADIGVRVQG
ncbi:MAG: flagellar hook-associated protein FlgK, partial [Rubrivivax sp.]|nr:flagellar hook-associated protein FlgK [Rubrivivax sp.]